MTLPFPIAYPHHLISAARNPTDRYERLIHCYEAVVRYFATVQLSDYLAAGCPDPDLNRKLLERLGQNLQLGHWLELAREVTTIQKKGAFRPFMPELVDFYFRPGRKPAFTPLAVHFDSTLGTMRNEWAPPELTWSAETFVANYDERRQVFDDIIAAVGFLARYTLYVPTDGRIQAGVVTEAVRLMGANDPPALASPSRCRPPNSLGRQFSPAEHPHPQ